MGQQEPTAEPLQVLMNQIESLQMLAEELSSRSKSTVSDDSKTAEANARNESCGSDLGAEAQSLQPSIITRSAGVLMVLVIVANMAMAMTSAMAASSVVAAPIAAESAAALAAVVDTTAEGARKPDQRAGTTPTLQPPGRRVSPKKTRDARSRRLRQQREQKAARGLAE
jgi:hypothetical protein